MSLNSLFQRKEVSDVFAFNSNHPFSHRGIVSYTLYTARNVTFSCFSIVFVLCRRSLSQILNSIVIFDAVFVINLMRRPLAVVDGPYNSMSKHQTTKISYRHVPICTSRPSYRPNNDFSGRFHLPFKVASGRIMLKCFTKRIDRDRFAFYHILLSYIKMKHKATRTHQ
jgi:hypothetical protein